MRYPSLERLCSAGVEQVAGDRVDEAKSRFALSSLTT